MKFPLFVFLLFLSAISIGQTISEEDRFISRLKPIDVAPDGLLSSRSATFFSPDYSQKELEEIQTGFQQIGVDAVCYVESEKALAGRDLMNAYGRYFISRDIKFLIFMKKDKEEYQVNFVLFNAKSSWIEPGQFTWFVHSPTLRGLLQTIFRALISSQKRQNFLVNDFPERNGPLSTIGGRREEDWAPGVRVFKIAVPRIGELEADKELELYLKENFHSKYELVEPDANEKDLLENKFVYVLRFIHTRGSLAKEILGYDMSKSESALATVNYPNGALQLKTIPSGNSIYKFYIKNIEEDVFYLGRKWDADLTWQAALKNYVDGYRAAGKLN